MRRATLTKILALLAVSITVLTGCAGQPSSQGQSHAPFIALSNSFIGNSWRQTMVNDFQSAAEQAQKAGTISGFKVENAPGDNSATEQIAQIKTLLLQKPDILLIDPASPSALTPVIEQACSMGVNVVIFDSSSEAPCVTIVTNSFPAWATTATEAVIKAMHDDGNLLISRGVVGSAPEAEYYAAQKQVISKYPKVKVVGTVTGLCDSATAQQAVLGVIASLPKIEGVAGCGDGFGVAQAFQSAGKPIPAVTFEPSGRALQYWKKNALGSGSIAIMSDPGQVVAAMFAALQVEKGQKIPHTVVFPSVTIAESQLDAWLPHVAADQMASWPWTASLVAAQIKADENNTAIALPPIPGT